MKVLVNKSQMFDNWDDELSKYNVPGLSTTWGSLGIFKEMDITVEELLDFINKGYGIKINCK